MCPSEFHGQTLTAKPGLTEASVLLSSGYIPSLLVIVSVFRPLRHQFLVYFTAVFLARRRTLCVVVKSDRDKAVKWHRVETISGHWLDPIYTCNICCGADLHVWHDVFREYFLGYLIITCYSHRLLAAQCSA